MQSSKSRCSTAPASCAAPVYSNVRRNITVSYNLCANQDVLAWSYHLQGACENETAFYFANASNPKGVENLAVTTTLDPSSCMPCSCDSVLFFPEVNLCSKLTIVLLTQKHNAGGVTSVQDNSTTAVPGTTSCYTELSERDHYRVWKAVLCGPLQCAQKVEFSLVGEVATVATGSSGDGIQFDTARVENFLLPHLE
jgi:hypothetical protein